MNRESLKRHCEATCKKFKDVPTSGTYGEHRLVLDLLEQTEWIPVSERLPEIHQDVLLSLRGLDIVVGFRAETEPYFYSHGVYIEPQNVFAQMPLPETYNLQKSEPDDFEPDDWDSLSNAERDH